MNARHEDRRNDWGRRAHGWRQLTETNDGMPSGRRHARRRNQYTPIIERTWFLVLMGAVAVTILWGSAQGWLP